MVRLMLKDQPTGQIIWHVKVFQNFGGFGLWVVEPKLSITYLKMIDLLSDHLKF